MDRVKIHFAKQSEIRTFCLSDSFEPQIYIRLEYHSHLVPLVFNIPQKLTNVLLKHYILADVFCYSY